MSEGLARRLVAVMFTDMVGYTALMQADERLGLDKRDRYTSALESHHDAFGGTIVQRLGDGSMSMFASSLAALIGDKKALLLLDNLEQVVAAASDVAGLAESCPGLRIVTMRDA